MTTMLDIITASALGGIILLITINANGIVRESWASYNSDYIVQQMLITNSQIVESEFRNMGCGVDTASRTIDQATDTCISFNMAPWPDMSAIPIKYYSGSPAEVGTPNPHDRFLYRVQNNGAPERVGLVTQFRLVYIDNFGDTLATPVSNDELKTIRMIEITMEVQSPWAAFLSPDTKEQYATALWKQTRLASQNLYR
jgi:hypothetical protein